MLDERLEIDHAAIQTKTEPFGATENGTNRATDLAAAVVAARRKQSDRPVRGDPPNDRLGIVADAHYQR